MAQKLRQVDAIITEYNSVKYRSKTEARWAVFFDELGLTHSYEQKAERLSTGQAYLPDFFIKDFDAFFEVKPANDGIVSAECVKARQLAADLKGKRVWLAMGAPAADAQNILPLEKWPLATKIEGILADPENRYFILEDRRDDKIYWLQSNQVSGVFRHTYMIGGPGVSTTHDRAPLLRDSVAKAYAAAEKAFK
jgi:hypothetical protein